VTEWAFLTNHALVLMCLAESPLITAIDVADSVGITERATRKIIADLEEAGYIDKAKEGRRVRYSVQSEMLLRGGSVHDTAIGELLKTLGWKQILPPEKPLSL
jgi:DNA-binding MarR family transcriptional regulator